jgi:hypothetical protein
VLILVKFINVHDALSPNQGVHSGLYQLSETSCFSTLLNGTAFAWFLSRGNQSGHLRTPVRVLTHLGLVT